jgi:hypothetical protein
VQRANRQFGVGRVTSSLDREGRARPPCLPDNNRDDGRRQFQRCSELLPIWLCSPGANRYLNVRWTYETSRGWVEAGYNPALEQIQALRPFDVNRLILID